MRIILFLVVFLNSPLTIFGNIESNEGLNVPEKKKVVLITGASRGIGSETAKKMAGQGHCVYASMRSIKTCESANLSSTLHFLELDITNEASIAKAVQTVVEREGRLDVLVNNAGCAVFGPMELVSIDQAKKVFEVNFFGTMRLMQAVLPIMREQGEGLIINLSSTSGVRPSPGWDIYGASKFAIEGLSEAVAALARQWNIDIVVVEPGTTATEFMTKSTEFGNRRIDKTRDYEHFMSNALKWMNERLADGQSPTEVAEVIANVVSSKQRQFRYQTSPKGKQTVANRHCDPTGDQSIREQAALVKQLWAGALDAKTGSSYR